MLNFCDFIQVFIFTTNHHLNIQYYLFFLFTFPFCVFPRVLKFLMRPWGHLTDCMDMQTDKSPHCSHIPGYAFLCGLHHICPVDMHKLTTWHWTLGER